MYVELESYSRRRKKRQKKARVLLFFIFVLILVYFLISKFIFSNSTDTNAIISPLAAGVEIIKKSMESPISKIAKEELLDDDAIYGIYVKNLKTGEKFSYNEDLKFATASLYKLWAMVAAFEKIENKSLRENEVLKEDIAVLNERFQIASEEAELTEGVAQKTVIEAIDKMITISDNYSAYLLVSKIRNASLTDFLNKYGFKDSHIGSPPETTAKEMALYFEKLYKKEYINSSYSEKMLELLKRQTFNDRIPKYLPEDILVAHKTGELGRVKHDAGIVFNKNDDYIIVVLSNSKKPLESAERTAKFSKAVFDYFNN